MKEEIVLNEILNKIEHCLNVFEKDVQYYNKESNLKIDYLKFYKRVLYKHCLELINYLKCYNEKYMARK